MKPCPECSSDNGWRYKEYVDATEEHVSDMLPKLADSEHGNLA